MTYSLSANTNVVFSDAPVMLLLELGRLETQFILTRFHPVVDCSSIVMLLPNKTVAVVVVSVPLSSMRANPLLVVSYIGGAVARVPGIAAPIGIVELKLNGLPGTVEA